MTTVRYWSTDKTTDVIIEEFIGKVHDMILANRRTNVREIAEAVSKSYESVINILRDKLSVKKVSVRCMPHGGQ